VMAPPFGRMTTGITLMLLMLVATRCSHPSTASVRRHIPMRTLARTRRACVPAAGLGLEPLRLRGGRAVDRRTRLDAHNDRMADKVLAFYAKEDAEKSKSEHRDEEGELTQGRKLSDIAEPNLKLSKVITIPICP